MLPAVVMRLGRTEAAALAGVMLLCALAFAWPAWLAQFPLEIDLNEPWVAWQVAALRAHALYPPVGGLVSNNYPPLFFMLLDVLAGPDGDIILVGRMLSLVGTLGCGVAIALLVRRLGGGWLAALLGGTWFVGTMARHATWYVGMNNPSQIGLMLMLFGLLLLRGEGRTRGSLGLLAIATGGFCKNSLVATPLAAIGLVALARGRGAALRAAAVLAALVVLGLAVCAIAFGPNVLPQLFLYPRSFSLLRAFSSLERLANILPGLLLWGLWARAARREPAAPFTVLYVGLALAAYLVQKVSDQIDINAEFELMAAVAIGVGLAFEHLAALPLALRIGVRPLRLAVLGLLGIWIVRFTPPEPFLFVTSPAFRETVRSNAEVMRREVARVAAIPGDVACTFQTVCYRAGKPFVYDITYAIVTGRITQRESDEGHAPPGVAMIGVDRRVSARFLGK